MKYYTKYSYIVQQEFDLAERAPAELVFQMFGLENEREVAKEVAEEFPKWTYKR